MSSSESVIHVVDDDASFLKAVARLLRTSGYTVKTFNSAIEFLAQLAPDAQGCVVADLNMPNVNGLELQEALVNAGNAIPVVFLTGAGDIPSTVSAMRRGAEDFLDKRAPKNELINAVNRAFARDARQRAETARLHELRTPFELLTPRDREVLLLVLDGRLNKQIARSLGIDERSVKRHRTSIMTKLRVESVAALTHLVHAAGLHGTDTRVSNSAQAAAVPRP